MDDPVTEKKGKGGLIAGLVIVFAIIAAVVVFIVIRNRKKGRYVFVNIARRSLNRNVQNRGFPLFKMPV